MSARDSLAERLAEHLPSIKNAANTSGWCPVCVQWLRDDAFAAHQADVALAWMAENGWVQGHEEWGLCDGEAVFKLDPDTEGMARRIAAADNSLSIIRRINATTDWEEVK